MQFQSKKDDSHSHYTKNMGLSRSVLRGLRVCTALGLMILPTRSWRRLLYSGLVLALGTSLSLKYAGSLEEADPEWYRSTEHLLVDLLIALVWYLGFLTGLCRGACARPPLSRALTAISSVDSQLRRLGLTVEYGKCDWVRLPARNLALSVAIAWTYTTVEMDSGFSKTWITLLSYYPLPVMLALEDLFLALLHAETALVSAIPPSPVFLPLLEKLLEAASDIRDFFSPQLILVCVHVFVRGTTNVYFSVFTVVFQPKDWEYAINSASWGLLDLYELWSIVTAVSQFSERVENFYFSVYELMINDRTGKLINDEELRLKMELKKTPKFLLYGFLPLDIALINSMLGAMCTYVVILMQFQLK